MKVHTKRLEIGNLPEFQRPAFADTLRFPTDLTKLGAQNLSELMGRYAALLAFVEQEATTWEIQEIKTEQTLENTQTKLMVESPRLALLEKWRLDLRLRQEDSVKDLNRRLTVIRTLKVRARSLVKTYEQLIGILSRELSRRLSTNDGQRFQSLNGR